jgi:SAM-dependent methyltransferase
MDPDEPTDPLAALSARVAMLERNERHLRDFVVPALWDVLDRLYARTPVSDTVECLACGRPWAVRDLKTRVDQCLFGGGRLERFECAACGCVFGPLKYLQTPAEVIQADYRLLYAHYQEGDSTEAEIRAFELLEPEPGKLYLNWGSGGWSRSVEILRARGYDVWGYEPNAPSDSPFVVTRREQISARFDGIFSNNVIEHLLDPAAQFLDFGRVLAEDGRMAHASPCFQWSHAYTRFHVFFPLGRAPQALAARTGFRVAQTVADGDFQACLFLRQDG